MSGTTFVWNVILLAVMLGVVLTERTYRAKLSPRSAALWRQGLAGVVVALVPIVVVCGVNILLFGSISLFDWLRFSPASATQFVLFQLIVAAWEELFFRFWLLEALGRHIPSRWAVIFLSALLFALLHTLTDPSVVRFVIPLAMGVWFGYARHRCSACSIYSLILAHLLYNLTIL